MPIAFMVFASSISIANLLSNPPMAHSAAA